MLNISGIFVYWKAYLFVVVEVRDINDAPEFASATIDTPVSEVSWKNLSVHCFPLEHYWSYLCNEFLQTSVVGTVVTRIMAIDHDLSNNGVILYSLEQIVPVSTSSNLFIINQFTGDLIVAQSLSLNTPYQLRITATVSVH